MDMSMFMAMANMQGIKMTPIANAMATGQSIETENEEFLDVMTKLMESVVHTEETSEDCETMKLYLNFLKKMQEVDATKIDAGYFQSIVDTIWPLVNEGMLDETDALAIVETLTAGPTMNPYAMEMSTKLDSDDVFNDVHEFLIQQGVSLEQANEVTSKLMDQKPWQNASFELKDVTIETVSAPQKEAADAFNQMMPVRPKVAEVSMDELRVITKMKDAEEPVMLTSDREELPSVKGMEVLAEPQRTPFEIHRSEEASNLADDPAIRAGVIDQVQSKLMTALQEEKTELVMKLKPEGLGEITVNLVTQENGKILLSIQTQSQETRAILSQEVQQLKESLLPYNTEVGEISTYVTNDGFYQQSSYRQNGQQQQNRTVRHGYDYLKREEGSMEAAAEVKTLKGRLLTYA